jgi:predicted nuclease with TOPRIM domain
MGFDLSVNDANQDFDYDGLPNIWEYLMGLDPTDPTDATEDADGDGIPNNIEFLYGLDANLDDAQDDKDGDGLTNLEEYQMGTNLLSVDTDGDGYSDYDEIKYGSDPLDAKSNKTRIILKRSLTAFTLIITISCLSIITYLESYKPWKEEITAKLKEVQTKVDELTAELSRIIEGFSSINSTLEATKEPSQEIMDSFSDLDEKLELALLKDYQIVDNLYGVESERYGNLNFLRIKLSEEQRNKIEIIEFLKLEALNIKAAVITSLDIIKAENYNKRIEAQLGGIKKVIVTQTQELGLFLEEIIEVKNNLEELIKERKDYYHIEEEFKSIQSRFWKIELKLDYNRAYLIKLSSEVRALDEVYYTLKKEFDQLSNRILEFEKYDD